MKAIVVVDKNWAIGCDGKLLTHLSGDLKFFKEKTLGKVIVYGRKTIDTFPHRKPLPGRTNIILTGNREYKNDGAIVCVGKEELLKKLKDYEDDCIYICGGASVYEEFIDLCDEVYVTKMEEEFTADRYFPNLDLNSKFSIVWKDAEIEENGIKYRFYLYKRGK